MISTELVSINRRLQLGILQEAEKHEDLLLLFSGRTLRPNSVERIQGCRHFQPKRCCDPLYAPATRCAISAFVNPGNLIAL